jgi:hypothetical protein
LESEKGEGKRVKMQEGQARKVRGIIGSVKRKGKRVKGVVR